MASTRVTQRVKLHSTLLSAVQGSCRQRSVLSLSNVCFNHNIASLQTHSVPAFIRALICLSRYGDDVVIYADSEHLSLSATNSSLSAYCRFKYGRRFFSRYKFRDGVARDGIDDVKGQLLAKVCLLCHL